MLGYLILDSDKTLIFSYLFTIVNASQGTVIFVFHCLVSKSVREELLKTLRKQKHRLLSGTSSLSSNQPSSRKLQRGGGSNSSSFQTNKKLDSTRLINRKSSNCSGNLNKKPHSEKEPSLLQLFLEFICCLQRQFEEESKSSVSGGNSKTVPSIDDEESCAKLIQTDSYLSNKSRMNTISYHAPVVKKSNLPPVYFDQRAQTLRNANRLVANNPANMLRTSSQLSSNSNTSNNPTQSTYLSPVQFDTTQAVPPPPIMPPPLPFPNAFYSLEAPPPPSNASLLRNKESTKVFHPFNEYV